MPSKIQLIESKILDGKSLERQLNIWKLKGLKIVFTNGCFDILHLGHATYLAAAADLGDVLIIGLNSDSSVRGLKGTHRPINNEKARATLLASLHFVSAVAVFNDPTPINLIKTVLPDVLVKGGDYRPEEIVGYDTVKAKGGRIVALDLVPGYSTTAIEQKLKEFRGL